MPGRHRRLVPPVVLAVALTGGCGQLGGLTGQNPPATTTASSASASSLDPAGGTTSPSESGPESSTATDTATETSTDTPTDAPTTSTPGDPAAGTSTAPTDPTATTGTQVDPGGTPTTGPPPGSTTPGAVGRSVVVDGRTIPGFPPALTFPAGTKVATSISTGPTSGTLLLGAPDETTALTHFRTALPRAGYRVLADTGGTLAFSGQGFRGSVTGSGPVGVVLTWSELAP